MAFFAFSASDWLISPSVCPGLGSVNPSVPNRFSAHIKDLPESHLKGMQSYLRGDIFSQIRLVGLDFFFRAGLGDREDSTGLWSNKRG